MTLIAYEKYVTYGQEYTLALAHSKRLHTLFFENTLGTWTGREYELIHMPQLWAQDCHIW